VTLTGHVHPRVGGPALRRTQKAEVGDGGKLRRYKRRWKVERLFAWLGNFRRLVVRYERQAENYLGFVRWAA